ncbi:MAG: hypothetical protein Q4F06_10335 [Eubacteriales bacterium]|nr:hypothetical protein [Eubacteriales bacterium]
MDKIRRILFIITDIMELVIAIAVGIAMIISTVMYIPKVKEIILFAGGTDHFFIFLEEVFVLVVGIEFIKMLCKPSVDNVIEVILFLLARHMIIGNNSALDNLLSVISIGFLFVLKNYLKYGHIKGSKSDDEKIDGEIVVDKKSDVEEINDEKNDDENIREM